MRKRYVSALILTGMITVLIGVSPARAQTDKIIKMSGMFAKAQEAEKKKQTAKAEATYKEAMAYAKKNEKVPGTLEFMVWDEIASFYVRQKNYKKSIPWAEKMVGFANRTSPKQPELKFQALDNLVTAHRKLGNAGPARKYETELKAAAKKNPNGYKMFKRSKELDAKYKY